MATRGFHQVMGLLGTGDLHPGGRAATETLVSWLAPKAGGRILEVGAGIGNTSRRLAGEGWQVTALEPDPVLFKELCKIPGIDAYQSRLAEHQGQYDAVIAESVLYNLVPEAFKEIRRLLKPSGRLVFGDMVWTSLARSEITQTAHDDSRQRFGIPVASAQPYNWLDWKSMLADAGFRVLQDRCLGPGSPSTHTRLSRAQQVLKFARHPTLVFDCVKMLRQTRSQFRVSRSLLESWICCAEAVD